MTNDFENRRPQMMHNYTLIAEMQSSIQRHEITCEEEAVFRRHKGICPGFPKGHYCCRNLKFSADSPLYIVFNEFEKLCEVHGILGLLGIHDFNVSIFKYNATCRLFI